MNVPRKTGFLAKFRIVSTIADNSTRLIDMETGNTVGLVQKIQWSAEAGQPYPKCVIEMYGVDLDVEVEADVVKTGFVKHGAEGDVKATRTSTFESKAHGDDWGTLLKAIEDGTLPTKPAAKKRAAKKVKSEKK